MRQFPVTGTMRAGPGPMTRSWPGISAGTSPAEVTDTGVRLRAGRRYRCRIRLSPDPVCTPIMHEQTSADDQTAAQIDPSRASSERPHDVSAAMHKVGVRAGSDEG